MAVTSQNHLATLNLQFSTMSDPWARATPANNETENTVDKAPKAFSDSFVDPLNRPKAEFVPLDDSADYLKGLEDKLKKIQQKKDKKVKAEQS